MALASQSHGYGSITNSERRNITDIGTSEPLIDWRRLLKEAVKYDIDWSYQNAGIEDGVVTAYLEEMPRPETEIVLDTSGSIDETLLRNFLRECKIYYKHLKLKLDVLIHNFMVLLKLKMYPILTIWNFMVVVELTLTRLLMHLQEESKIR